MGGRRATSARNPGGDEDDQVAAAAADPDGARGLARAGGDGGLVLEVAAGEAQGLGRGGGTPGGGGWGSGRSAVHHG